MELNDFKIGDKFYTEVGEWLILDIGTFFVIAIKTSIAITLMLDEYSGSASIFDSNDIDGCFKSSEQLNFHQLD